MPNINCDYTFTRLCRVLKVLHEYVMECDADFCEERTFVPLYRASRGKQLMLLFRFPNQGRQVEDVEIWTHTNDTLGAVRRQILQRQTFDPVGSLPPQDSDTVLFHHCRPGWRVYKKVESMILSYVKAFLR